MCDADRQVGADDHGAPRLLGRGTVVDGWILAVVATVGRLCIGRVSLFVPITSRHWWTLP